MRKGGFGRLFRLKTKYVSFTKGPFSATLGPPPCKDDKPVRYTTITGAASEAASLRCLFTLTPRIPVPRRSAKKVVTARVWLENRSPLKTHRVWLQTQIAALAAFFVCLLENAAPIDIRRQKTIKSEYRCDEVTLQK
jgi:hypothetical protein